MIMTIEELQEAAKKLPEARIAADMGMREYRIAIPEMIPVAPWQIKEPSPLGPQVRIVFFELRKIAEHGSIRWRWQVSKETDIIV